jgi:carbon monoxide dehydrogenase subunit G
MDIPRIVPCMPGAELIERVDGRTYRGKVSLRLGPVALAFVGTALFESLDEAARRARVRAQGTDAKGRGGAVAIVDFQLQPAPEGTSVLVNTDINLTGSVAQYGRASGIIQGVANQLMAQFADNLRKSFAPQQGRPAGQDSTPQPNAVPISGFSLIVRALWTAIKRLFTREGPDGPKAR